MKPRRIFSAARLSLPFASALVALFTAHSAKGQTTRYWDGNNKTANFGSASGTWAAPTTGTATAGWSASAAGATLASATTGITVAAPITTARARTRHHDCDGVPNGIEHFLGGTANPTGFTQLPGVTDSGVAPHVT